MCKRSGLSTVFKQGFWSQSPIYNDKDDEDDDDNDDDGNNDDDDDNEMRYNRNFYNNASTSFYE